MKAMVQRLAIVSVLGAQACAPTSGPLDVEALVVDGATGEVRRDIVTLNQIVDLWSGRGTRFDVRGRRSFDYAALDAAVRLGPENRPGRTAVITSARATADVEPTPALSFDGQKWIAHDYDSLVYLTTLSAYERAFDFLEFVVRDRSAATTTPTLVALHGWLNFEVAAPANNAAAVTAPYYPHDNALYLQFADAFTVPRTVLDTGTVPLALDEGVVAHEVAHRRFAWRVAADNGVWWAMVNGEIPSDIARASQTILSGINEGLADLNAVAFVGDVRWLRARAGIERDLEGPLADGYDYDRLRRRFGDDDADDAFRCGTRVGDDLFTSPSVNPYCLGTLVARAFWDAAGRDMDTLRTVYLPSLQRALRPFGNRIANRLRQEPVIGLRLDVDDLIETVAADLAELEPREALEDFCLAFARKFPGLMTTEKVPTCTR